MNFDEFFQRVSQATRISTQKELAKMLGIKAPGITLAKSRGVPEHWLHVVASLYGLSYDWLKTGKGSMRRDGENLTLCIPKVSAKACAGAGSLEVESNTIGVVPFEQDWIQRKGQPKNMVAMDIVGDSMIPEIQPGDTVLVDLSHNEPSGICPYILSLAGELLVKRIQARPGLVTLFSDNPKYPPITLQGDELETLRIIGKVLWTSRSYV
ncbi:MAG: helix-turn-helix transcriptional regulator [Deltaproteobacteria bacterium]|nr:helix-turn-helix transcriptional regulator [Deltaproteobacteria bacterium]